MRRKLISIVGAISLAAVAAPGVASAATFEVNDDADGPASPADCQPGSTDPCSVRDAITAANSSSDPSNTVDIPAGDYEVTEGQLSVGNTDDNTTIVQGAGARDTTLDAGGSSRVIDVAQTSAEINDLTITGGASSLTDSGVNFPGDGGGILMGAPALTLNRVRVTDNTAEQNGAGIGEPPEASGGLLTVNESTIDNNTISAGIAEGGGGGIYAFSDLAITNSTISDNSIDTTGVSQGGGVVAAIETGDTDGTSLTLLNSTIAGNSVSAGGTAGGIGIDNPLGSGVTTVAATNTIVAGNTAGGATGNCTVLAMPTSTNNLSDDSSCMFTDSGSQEDTDPQLGDLDDNGGPTDTRAIDEDSPAFDAGTDVGCPATDQRGVTRPQGDACDIGAFEFEPPAPPPAADLEVDVKAKPAKPTVGQRTRFTITAANDGPDAATAMIIKGKLPKDARMIKSEVSCHVHKAKHKRRRFKCDLGTMESGANTKLKVAIHPDGVVRRPRAAAKVSSAVDDPNESNNRAKAVVKVKKGK